jgi:hypothetical protein
MTKRAPVACTIAYLVRCAASKLRDWAEVIVVVGGAFILFAVLLGILYCIARLIQWCCMEAAIAAMAWSLIAGMWFGFLAAVYGVFCMMRRVYRWWSQARADAITHC